MTVVFRPSGVWMISFIAIEFDLTPQDYSPMPTHPSDTLQLRCVQGGSTTSLIEPSADKMSCDFTSNQLVQESTFPSTSQPPTSNSMLLQPTNLATYLSEDPPHPQTPLSLLHSHPHSPLLPPCLMALLLPQPMGPPALSLVETAAVLRSDWSRRPRPRPWRC